MDKSSNVVDGDDEVKYVHNHGDWISYHSDNSDGGQSIGTDEDWPPISSSSSSLLVANEDGDDEYNSNSYPPHNEKESGNIDGDTDEDWPQLQSSNNAVMAPTHAIISKN